MRRHTPPDLLAQLHADLAAQRAELLALRRQVATQGATLAALRIRHRRRPGGRLAALVAVALLVALLPLSALAVHPFTDLDPAQETGHNPNIDAIYNAGITRGCNPPDNDNYCPTANVTRQEMASFLARTAGLGGNPPVANAAQLGGQPASAYLRTGQDIIGSPLLPHTSMPFTTGGGALLIFASGSGYSATPGQWIGMDVLIDGNLVGTARVLTNEANSHKAFVPIQHIVHDRPAGSHTITLLPLVGGPYNTTTDANDSFLVTVIELPLLRVP